MECAECGVIYRSRQYWFGNDDPVNTVVRTELRHAWPGVRFGCYEKETSPNVAARRSILWREKIPIAGTTLSVLKSKHCCERETRVGLHVYFEGQIIPKGRLPSAFSLLF